MDFSRIRYLTISPVLHRSSLINSILGELRVLAGTTEALGKFAYFSQNPFILNDSVKNNILFSHVHDPVDEERYQKAIECCALSHDLRMLPAGDETEIGEKGITLSGGQKARVALARAVYHRADISLIDDALAAVDAHVAKHLFQQCIVEELLEGEEQSKRSVVLATNALHHLQHPRVDIIYVIRDGRVVEQGTYASLSQNSDSEFSRFLNVIDKTGVDGSALPDMDLDGDGSDRDGERESPTKRISLTNEAGQESETPNKQGQDASRLMKEEQSATGTVSGEVYISWARAAGGIWIPCIVIILFGAGEGIQVLSKWWLTYWPSHSDGNQLYFLGIYALINLAAILAMFVRVLLLFICGIRASKSVSDSEI